MNAFNTVVKFFQDSGLFIYPSILIMALGLAVAIERFIFLNRARAQNRKLWEKVLPMLLHMVGCLLGKPVEGILVLAFDSPIIEARPLFVSDKTDKDGKYRLRVSYDGGKYYLRLRDDYGGGPLRQGEFKGVYGDTEPAVGLVVKPGQRIKDIDIRAFRFAGRGPMSPLPVK